MGEDVEFETGGTTVRRRPTRSEGVEGGPGRGCTSGFDHASGEVGARTRRQLRLEG